MKLTVTVVTEDGTAHRMPIDAKTRVGQVLQDVAYKVSRRPNLLTASLTYRGSLLPLDMRACALPEGSTLNFYMTLDDANANNMATSVLDTSHRSMLVNRHTLLVQLPSSKEARRVHVDPQDPIGRLRDVLEVPSDCKIHYNKRPILDESRTIASLRMSDKYLVTFAPYTDTSFLTAAVPPPTFAPPSASEASYTVGRGTKPNSQQNALYMSELQSPSRRRIASPTSQRCKSPSGWPEAQTQNNAFSNSRRSPGAREQEPSAPAVAYRHYTTPQPPPPPPVERGDLFDASSVHHSRRSQRDDFPGDFSDMRLPQAASVGAPSPLSSHYRSHLGGGASPAGPTLARSPATNAITSSTMQSRPRGGPTTLNIFVSDPDDGGFTHDLSVNPDRKVSSLRQFVTDPDLYDVYCDTILVQDPDHVSFWDATGGKDGSLFTFEPQRQSRLSLYH